MVRHWLHNDPYLKFRVILCKRRHKITCLLNTIAPFSYVMCMLCDAITIPFAGALCYGDEEYHLCILWQRMGLWIILILCKELQQFSSHLVSIKYLPVIFIPEWTAPITAKLHFNLVAECLEKSLPFIGAPVYRSLAYFCGTSWL